MARVEVDSVEKWSEVCSSAFVPLRVRAAAPRFVASIDQVRLTDDVSLTRVSSGASEVYRSDQVIRRHPREELLVSFHRAGDGRVRQRGRETRLHRGGAAMYDASTPYTLGFDGRMSEVVLQVPRRVLPRTGGAFADLTARPLPDTAAMRALTALVLSVDHRAVDRRPREDHDLADALTVLLRSVVLEGSERIGVDGALLVDVLRRHIDDHLHDPALTPAGVAAAHHVSLRSAQKAFAAAGDSLGGWIRRRRLAVGHDLLQTGSGVAQAAAAAAYLDVDAFSRAFKQEYGYRPVEVRRLRAVSGP